MSFVSLTGLLASISGVVMALSPLLQARRVHEIRDSSEVSQAFVCVLIGNACVWIVHGVATADAVLVIPNMVTIGAAGATLAIVRRYRHGGAHEEADAEPASAHAAVTALDEAIAAHRVAPEATHEHELARVHAGAAARARRAVSFARR